MRADYGHGLFGVPDDDGRPEFQWLHLRPGEQVYLVIGNRVPLWYWAHWVDGRMQPCPKEDCRFCNAGIGRQRRWVFAVAMRHRTQPFLWEVSNQTADRIREFAERFDTITNLALDVRREAGSSKARITIECDRVDPFKQGESLQFPELSEALDLTWSQLRVGSEVLSEELSRSRTSGREGPRTHK